MTQPTTPFPVGVPAMLDDDAPPPHLAKARSWADLVLRLRAAHGDRLYLLHDRFRVVCRAPKRGEWDRFMAMKLDDAQKTRALPQIARSCIVWVDGARSEERTEVLATWDALLEEWPAVSQEIGADLTRIAAADEEVEAKKL